MRISWTLWIYLACMAVLVATAVYVSAIVARMNRYAQLVGAPTDKPDYLGTRVYEAEVMPHSSRDPYSITFRGDHMAPRLFQGRTLLGIGGVGSRPWYAVQSVEMSSNLIDDSNRRFVVRFNNSDFEVALRAGNYENHDEIAREIQSELDGLMVFNARSNSMNVQNCTASDCHALELEIVGPGAQPFQVQLSSRVATTAGSFVFDTTTISSASDGVTPRQIARWQFAQNAGLFPPAGIMDFEPPDIVVESPLTIELKYGSGPFSTMGTLKSGRYTLSAFVQNIQSAVRSAAPSFRNIDATYSSDRYSFSLRNAATVDGDVELDFSRNPFLTFTLGLSGDVKTISLGSSRTSSWTGLANPPLVRYVVTNARVDQDASDVPIGTHHVLATTPL